MSEQINLWYNYRATEDFFLKQLQMYQEKELVYEIHFEYNSLIKLYSMHLIQPDAAEKLVDICLKDIELFPAFKKAYFARNPEYTVLPSIPSFKTLAIFFENRSRFLEAIDICHAALEYELTDGTKGGYAIRIAKLEKKLEKQLYD